MILSTLHSYCTSFTSSFIFSLSFSIGSDSANGDVDSINSDDPPCSKVDDGDDVNIDVSPTASSDDGNSVLSVWCRCGALV